MSLGDEIGLRLIRNVVAWAAVCANAVP